MHRSEQEIRDTLELPGIGFTQIDPVADGFVWVTCEFYEPAGHPGSELAGRAAVETRHLAGLKGEAEGPRAAEPAPIASSRDTEQRERGEKIRVLLADDHAIMRQGLLGILREEADIDVVGEASNGQISVEMARSLLPDVVIMDMSMPVMNGLEATRIIKTELPGVCVIGLSMYEESEGANAMILAGACAYLSKTRASEELVAAIRACFSPHRDMK